MKKLTILILLCIIVFVVGCGGGSGKDENLIITEDPVTPIIEMYNYSVTRNDLDQSYNGKCVYLRDNFYCYPVSIADSPFVASAKIEDDNVKLFSYFDRSLIVEFNIGGDSGYNLSLTEIGLADLGSIDGVWYNKSYAGLFGDIIITAIYDDGVIHATDTSGCNISGSIKPLGGIYSVDLMVVDCPDEGEYSGALHVIDGQIRGSVSNENKSLILDFNVD